MKELASRMKKYKLLIIFFMGFFSWLFGCRTNDTKQEIVSNDTMKIKLEEITDHIDTAEDWNDIFLKIVSEIKTDSSHIYISKGLYHGNIVGIKCEIKNNIKAGIVNGKMNEKGFARNSIQLISIGQESDQLIKALSELYKFPTKKQFRKSISPSLFSLNEKEINRDSEDYFKLKLFFNEDSETLYSELYFNIDLRKRIIEIHEKDEDYRLNVIKALVQ